MVAGTTGSLLDPLSEQQRATALLLMDAIQFLQKQVSSFEPCFGMLVGVQAAFPLQKG